MLSSLPGRKGPTGLYRHAVAEDIVMQDTVKAASLHADIVSKYLQADQSPHVVQTEVWLWSYRSECKTRFCALSSRRSGKVTTRENYEIDNSLHFRTIHVSSQNQTNKCLVSTGVQYNRAG